MVAVAKSIYQRPSAAMPKFSGKCGCGRFYYNVPWRSVTANPPPPSGLGSPAAPCDPLKMPAFGGKADIAKHAAKSANDPKRTWALAPKWRSVQAPVIALLAWS